MKYQTYHRDFEEFDLILTMDYSNLTDVNSLVKEFRCSSKVVIRPILSYSSQTKFLDVPDPYYGGVKGFDLVLNLLEDACDGLLAELNS